MWRITVLMTDLSKLGERVQQQRIAAGLKQQELADHAAVSRDALSALENGRPVTTATLARILAALGYTDALTNLVPAPAISPLDMQKLRGKERRRVR
jgi:transcriptional regulator with XRE-family HTH domain